MHVCHQCQALAEAHAARYSNALGAVGTACTCSVEGENASSEEMAHAAAALAVDEVAAVAFVGNELFMLIRELEVQLEREGKQSEPRSNLPTEEGADEENDANVGKQSHQAACEARTSLGALRLSHTYRMLAEESMDRGQADEAAALYDEAYTEGVGYVPNRCTLLAICCLTFSLFEDHSSLQ